MIGVAEELGLRSMSEVAAELGLRSMSEVAAELGLRSMAELAERLRAAGHRVVDAEELRRIVEGGRHGA